MNLSLKHKLMLQSLSPLAFLTIVRNFKFTPVSELAENQSYWGEFVRLNNVLIVVFLLCATWILAAIISFISFTAFASVYKGIHIKTTKNGLPTY